VDRTAIRTIGHDLQRPECILAEPDGTLWSADARGGVMRIGADCAQRLIAQQVDTHFEESDRADKYILKGTLTTIPYFRAPVAGLPMVHWHERRAP
jgi:gluconolactonase